MNKTLQQLKDERTRLDAEIAQAEKGSTPPPPKVNNKEDDPLATRESDFNIAGETDMVIFQPRHNLMGRQELREQDQRPQRIFFYKRLDTEEMLTLTEAEAARLLESNIAPMLRQIGVSDGSAYANFMRNCGVRTGERIPLSRAKEILHGAAAAELEAARGHYDDPLPQNVHFDSSIRRHKNAKAIIQGFTPT